MSKIKEEILKEFDKFVREEHKHVMKDHWAGVWATVDRARFNHFLSKALDTMRDQTLEEAKMSFMIRSDELGFQSEKINSVLDELKSKGEK